MRISTWILHSGLHWLDRHGLCVWKRSSVPFGVQWTRDLQYFSQGRALAAVLDVGANVGQTATELLANFPDCTVHCFEPVRATFDVLRTALAAAPRATLVNAALGEAVGTSEILSCEDSLRSSMAFGEVGEIAPGTERETVQVDTVDSYCERHGIERLSLLKIDTEGFELPVLRGAERMLGDSRVDFVLAECDFERRPDAPHGDFFELHRHLAPLGFAVVAFYTGGVDDCGWVWGDVLYVHRSAAVPGRVAMGSSATHRSS